MLTGLWAYCGTVLKVTVWAEIEDPFFRKNHILRAGVCRVPQTPLVI